MNSPLQGDVVDAIEKKAGTGKLKSVQLSPYLFLSPFIILFIVFTAFPFVFSIYLSFHLWNPVKGLDSMSFVGMENYVIALEDPFLWKSLYNTVWMGLASGASQHLIAIPVAFVLVQVGGKFRHLLSSAYFLPFITSSVAVSLIFYNMYSANAGIINQTLVWLSNVPVIGWFFGWVDGVMPIRWLETAELIKPSVAIVQTWKFTGFFIVIYVSGLLTIPQDINDAATMDGVTSFQRFWHISLPALRPYIFFGVTLTLIGSFQMFEEPFILTRGTGGVGQSGLSISMYLYKVGWEWLEMGTASALSWLLFIAIGICTGIYFLLFGKRGMDNSMADG